MPQHRVLITGVGVVNAAVAGASAALGAWLAAPRPAPRATTGGAPAIRLEPSALAGLLDGAEARRLSRVCQLTIVAARLALAEARVDPARGLGLVVGTELGDLGSTIEFANGYLRKGPAGLSALLFPSTVMNTMAATTAIAVGAREMALTLNAPTVAGELAVARGAAAVAAGAAPTVLAGGVDELDPLVAGAIAGLGGSDLRGEGAAFLVLESEAAAAARGVRALGEIRGAACGALPARPWGIGRRTGSRVIGRALAQASTVPAEVGWVYASAGGDAARDAWEQLLLGDALGPGGRPCASLTALVGHHAGLGALRVAAAAWTARAGVLPAAGATTAGGADAAAPPVRVRAGRGLVHGVARGGGQVALVVDAA